MKAAFASIDSSSKLGLAVTASVRGKQAFFFTALPKLSVKKTGNTDGKVRRAIRVGVGVDPEAAGTATEGRVHSDQHRTTSTNWATPQGEFERHCRATAYAIPSRQAKNVH